MFIYSVTIHIDKSVEKDWLHYMQEKHIGDVLATNYFLSCIIRKDVLDTSTNFTTYNIEYSLKDKQAYIDYQEKEALRLQADVKKYFDGKFTAERTFYEVILVKNNY